MHSIAHKRPRACLHVCLHVCTRGRLHVCRSVNNRPGPMLAAVSRPLLAAVSRPSARTRGRQYLHPGIVYILHTAYTAVYTRVHTYARLCTRAAVNTLTRGRAYLAHFVRQRHTLGLGGRILCRTKCASPFGTLFAAKHFVSQSGRPGTLFATKHFVAQSTLWHTLCRTKCFAAQSARRNKAGTRPEDPPIVSRFVSGLAGAPLVTRAAARAPPPRSSGRRTRTTSGARSDRAPLLGSGFVIRSEEGGARDEPLGRERSRERPAREERRREFRGPTTQSSREDS